MNKTKEKKRIIEKNLLDNFFFLFLIFIMLIPFTLAHKTDYPEAVHQYISKEAQYVWNQTPYEIKHHLENSLDTNINDFVITDLGYDKGDDIVDGSGEEDKDSCLRGLPSPDCSYYHHFFDPDDPNAKWDFDPADYNHGWENLPTVMSNYRRAKEYWRSVVYLYNHGDKDRAYYWLGRIAHLLEDATSPPHTHDDTHTPWNPSYLEDYTGDHYTDYEGSNYNSQGPYRYEAFPNMESFDWSTVEPDNKYLSNPGDKELFRLFWYTAQKTQYQASRDGDGNNYYYDLNENSHTFSPSLWQGDNIDIVSNKNDVQNNVKNISDAVMPHALKATAGLYRLFWDAVAIDWPFYHHDLRRTGFTLLKGDFIGDEDDQVSWTVEDDIDNTFRDYPSIADVNGDGRQEILTASSRYKLSSGKNEGKFYVLECIEKKGKCKTFRERWSFTDENIIGGLML